MRLVELDLGSGDALRRLGDTYGEGLPGQSFDVTGLPNGRYHLRVRANPLGDLREATIANNLAVRTIRLTGKRDRHRVAVRPWKRIRG